MSCDNNWQTSLSSSIKRFAFSSSDRTHATLWDDVASGRWHDGCGRNSRANILIIDHPQFKRTSGAGVGGHLPTGCHQRMLLANQPMPSDRQVRAAAIGLSPDTADVRSIEKLSRYGSSSRARQRVCAHYGNRVSPAYPRCSGVARNLDGRFTAQLSSVQRQWRRQHRLTDVDVIINGGLTRARLVLSVHLCDCLCRRAPPARIPPRYRSPET